jgi:hypothetical protein
MCGPDGSFTADGGAATTTAAVPIGSPADHFRRRCLSRGTIDRRAMELAEKLRVLADSAKYDASCASSGVTRRGVAGGLWQFRRDWHLPQLHARRPLRLAAEDPPSPTSASTTANTASIACRATCRGRVSPCRRWSTLRSIAIASRGCFSARDYPVSNYTTEQTVEVARRLRVDHKFGGYHPSQDHSRRESDARRWTSRPTRMCTHSISWPGRCTATSTRCARSCGSRLCRTMRAANGMWPITSRSLDRASRGAVLRRSLLVDALFDSDTGPVCALAWGGHERRRRDADLQRRPAAAAAAAGRRDRAALAHLLRWRVQSRARQSRGHAARNAAAPLVSTAGSHTDSLAAQLRPRTYRGAAPHALGKHHGAAVRSRILRP